MADSQGPLTIQVGDCETIKVPKGQKARLVCYLRRNMPNWVYVADMNKALNTTEASSRLSEVRSILRIPIDTKKAPKGRKFLYRLDPSVVVVAGTCNG